MKLATISILLLAILPLSTAKFSWGWCPKVPYQEKFDASKYMGRWYKLVRTTDFPYNKGTCGLAEYSLTPEAKLDIFNAELVGNEWKTEPAKGYCDEGVGHCYASYYGSPYIDFYVLKTDYDNFAVVYTCSNWGLFHWTYGWVLTRDKNYSDLNEYIDLLDRSGVTKDYLFQEDQSTCPEYS